MVNNILYFISFLVVFVLNAVQPNKIKEGKINCPAGPIITSTYCGELGNNLWDYASILSLSRLLPGNRQPYIRADHVKRVKLYFKPPLLPLVEDIPLNCSCWKGLDLDKKNQGWVLYFQKVNAVKKWPIGGNIVLHSPVIAVESIMHNIDYIRRSLKYKDEFIQGADKIFKDVSNTFLTQEHLGKQSLTYVGVHVRRTDYLDLLTKDKQVGAAFFNFAFDYFRRRKDLGKCVFLVVSDDKDWVKENLISNKTNSDVFLVGSGKRISPGVDIALLSFSNHTIFDYGSFGLWGAVYAGGEVVTTNSYGKAHNFVIYKNFHFFDPVPDKELLEIRQYKKQP